MVQIRTTFELLICNHCNLIYIRDAQRDHKIEVPDSKKTINNWSRAKILEQQKGEVKRAVSNPGDEVFCEGDYTFGGRAPSE